MQHLHWECCTHETKFCFYHTFVFFFWSFRFFPLACAFRFLLVLIYRNAYAQTHTPYSRTPCTRINVRARRRAHEIISISVKLIFSKAVLNIYEISTISHISLFIFVCFSVSCLFLFRVNTGTHTGTELSHASDLKSTNIFWLQCFFIRLVRFFSFAWCCWSDRGLKEKMRD